MAKVKLTKNDADKLMKIKDKSRGMVLKTLIDYIIKEKGEKGIEIIEKRLKELGFPLELKEISPFKWYQMPFDTLLILVILEVFDWDESKAFDIGYNSLIVHSLVAKLLLSRILSLETAVKNASKFWRYFSKLGEIKFTKYDPQKGFAILRLDKYKKIHPSLNEYLRGVITRIMEMLTKSKNIKVKQTKCLFWGDPYDEFQINW